MFLFNVDTMSVDTLTLLNFTTDTNVRLAIDYILVQLLPVMPLALIVRTCIELGEIAKHLFVKSVSAHLVCFMNNVVFYNYSRCKINVHVMKQIKLLI